MATAPTADTELWHGTARHTRDQERRRRLLDAALELYGTAGYRRTTVAAVCRLAKVSTRSFYELYADQEQLLERLYLDLNGEVLAALTELTIEPVPNVFAVGRRLVAAALGPMLQDERKARVLEVEVVGISEALEHERRLNFRRLADAVDTAFDALANARLIDRVPKGLTSLILVGGITEALVQRVQTEPSDRVSTPEFLDEVTRVIVSVTRPFSALN
jgi:AcrR family transcriptional regulator